MNLPTYSKKWLNLAISIGLLALFIFGLAFTIRRVMGENIIGADFFTFWQAGHSAFIDGLSPYDPQVTAKIQMGIYGELAKPTQDQLAFAYPAYALVFIFPFIFIDFPIAQALWMSIFLAAWLLIALRASGRASRWAGATLIFFYPLAFGILLGNFNILVGLALFILLGSISSSQSPGNARQILQGICMAVCMVKPQLSWIFILVGVLLTLKFRWWTQLITSLSAWLVLLLFSLLKFPGWISAWIQQTRDYSAYNPPEPLPLGFARQFLTDPAAQYLSLGLLFATGICMLWVLFRWIQRIRTPQFSLSDWTLMGLIGMITYLIHPWPKSYEQIVILTPFFFWIIRFAQKNKLAAVLLWTAGLLFSWAGFIDQLTGFTPLGIYAWPLIFFLGWQIYGWLTYPKAER